MDDNVDIDNTEVPEIDLNVSSSFVIHQTHRHKKTANVTPFKKSVIEHLKKK